MQGTSSVDWVARVVAVLGVLTGLGSFAWTLFRGRTRLSVIPEKGEFGVILIRVVNHSEFPVVIEEAGIEFKKGEPLKYSNTTGGVMSSNRQLLPVTLHARDSIRLECTENRGVRAAVYLTTTPARRAYVRTAEGHVRTGTSRALKMVANKAGDKSRKQE